jgi:ArsR family transcriptional regulator
LEQAELSVADLVAILVTGQSRISHHLKVLLDAELIVLRKEGLWSYYSARKDDPSGFIRFLSPKLKTEDFFIPLQKALDGQLRSKKENTREFFDTVADEWNSLREETIPDQALAKAIASFGGDGVIMDIGCGTGSLLSALSGTGRELIGVDQSAKMLQKAAEKTAPSGGRIQFRIGDAEHLPAKNGEIGFAVLNMVLHHLPLPGQGLKEVSRVLNEGGRFLLTELLPHDDDEFAKKFGDLWCGLGEDQLSSWIKKAGLKIMDKKIIPSGKRKQAVMITGQKQRSKK